jgi:hypothetical protein
MARRVKGKPARRTRAIRPAKSQGPTRRSVERPSRKASPKRKSAPARKTGGKAAAKKAGAKKAPAKKAAPPVKASARKRAGARRRPPSRNAAGPAKTPRLDRARRTLDETVQTPPSSLDLNRRGSAARTGRAGMADTRDEHRGMAPAITGGDADVDIENAYFTGDEAPGGDNPAPDEEVVDDIGKALGVQYDDQEELKSSDKIIERDKHRWEMDPASSEDYKDRK